MTHSSELRQRLRDGIAELEGDIARLRAAIVALDAPHAGASARSRPRRARRAPAPNTATAEAVPSGKLVSLLSSSDQGLSTADLARRTNGDRDQILELLKELEHAGRARRSGRRRSTLWHAPQPAGEPASAADGNGGEPAIPGDSADPAEAEKQVAGALDSVVAS